MPKDQGTTDRPGHVRVTAWGLLVIGSLSGIGWFSNSEENGGLALLALSFALVVAGLGLMWGRRWAWVLSVVLGLLLVIVGTWAAVFALADTDDGFSLIGSALLAIVPGALLLLSMLSAPTRRWLDVERGGDKGLGTNGVHRGHVRARLVIGLLILNVLVFIAWFASTGFQIGLLWRINQGGRFDLGTVEASDARQSALAVTNLAVYVIAGVAWLVWQHGAHSSLRVGGLRFSPGLAVGGWFIPIVNWFFPYQSVRELWQASSGRPDWTHQQWSILGWWWAFFLASDFSGLLGLLSRGQEVSEALARSYRWPSASPPR